MKIFPTEKKRILLVCMGFTILFLVTNYFLKNNRYKTTFVYQFYRCCTGNKQTVLRLYKPIDFRVDFFGMIYEGRSGNFIDDDILYNGAQEKYILFFLRDVADSLEKKGVVFFDIGANVGQHSLFMSRLVKEVHAFEPYPPVLDRFRKMVKINRIDNIFIHPVGLGNQNGKLPFFEPPDYNLGAGSFVSGFDRKNNDNTMPIVIGDELLKKGGISRVDIIKCDIEGYEKQALLGLKCTLIKNRPIFVMELNLGLEESFQSIDDFYATFPPDYEFLSFCAGDAYTGHYELCQYDGLNFEKKQGGYNLVVYPIEKKKYITLENKNEN